MWSNGGGGGGSGGVLVKTTATMMRFFFSSSSRKRAPNLKKINPRVAYQEAASIAEALYGVIKSHGPLTTGNAWNHAKDAGINGLSSKTHMKLMLKWMRGRSMLKQICNHIGSSKKFLLTAVIPGQTQPTQTNNTSSEEQVQTTEK
ncbi:hypothetical protein M569_09645, partial [Genlisea aurea]